MFETIVAEWFFSDQSCCKCKTSCIFYLNWLLMRKCSSFPMWLRATGSDCPGMHWRSETCILSALSQIQRRINFCYSVTSLHPRCHSLRNKASALAFLCLQWCHWPQTVFWLLLRFQIKVFLIAFLGLGIPPLKPSAYPDTQSIFSVSIQHLTYTSL